MNGFFAVLALVTQLFPLIVQAVHVVESQFPQSGQGTTKLDTVIKMVQGAADAAGVASEHKTILSAVLTPIINGVVSLSNSTGKFDAVQIASTKPIDLSASPVTSSFVASDH